jgi:hypothetical protein
VLDRPAVLRPSRDSPIPPALPRPTLPRRLHQIPVPVIRLGHPRTWVMAAVRCGAHARQTHPTCPVRLIGRGPIRTGPTRPTRWSRLLDYRRLASHRHNGRMLRLPSRSNTGARRSPPPSTVACDSGASGTSETGSSCSDPNARCQLIATRQNHKHKCSKVLLRNRIHQTSHDLDHYGRRAGKVERISSITRQ